MSDTPNLDAYRVGCPTHGADCDHVKPLDEPALETELARLRAVADAAREALGKIAANFDRAIELYEQHGGPIMLNEPIIEARHIARTTLHTIKEGEG